jgi:hypothetical protein
MPRGIDGTSLRLASRPGCLARREITTLVPFSDLRSGPGCLRERASRVGPVRAPSRSSGVPAIAVQGLAAAVARIASPRGVATPTFDLEQFNHARTTGDRRAVRLDQALIDDESRGLCHRVGFAYETMGARALS